MARAITAGAAGEAALIKAAAAYHRKRFEITGEKKTTAEVAAEKYDLEIPQGIALEMPAWLRDKAKAAIGESFEGEWWDGIGETTRDGLMKFVQLGLQDGWSIRRLATEIGEHFGGDQYPRWRANNIARTECLTGDVAVTGALATGAYRRVYRGPIVEIVTHAGRKFSGTPNHPMLTHRGWIALGNLTESDYLICDGGNVKEFCAPRNMHVENPPAPIAEIFDSLAAVTVIQRRAGVKPDFHGDGMEAEVDVLVPGGLLRYGRFIKIDEGVLDGLLPESDKRCCVLAASRAPFTKGFFDKADCFRRSAHFDAAAAQQSSYGRRIHPKAFANVDRRFPGFVSRYEFRQNLVKPLAVFGDVSAAVKSGPGSLQRSRLLAGHAQAIENSAGVPPHNFSNGGSALAGKVELDRLCTLRIRNDFAGHVYNLSAVDGYFVAAGFYTGNTGNAMNAGHAFAIEQLQEETGLPMGKEWLSILGPTTRITHADADGQQTETPDGLFNLAGYEVPWPAHESLPPEERCNCQCSIISSFVMSSVDEGDNVPDIIGLDEDTEAELPEPDDYVPGPAPEPEPELDPKISAALTRLEALGGDHELGYLLPPFKESSKGPTEADINQWRLEQINAGKDPLKLPTEKVKLSQLHQDESAVVRKAAVSAMIQDPEAKPGIVAAPGLPLDKPVIVQRDGKLYIQSGHEELTALKLLKKTKAEVYLLDMDAGKAGAAATASGGTLPPLASLKDTGKALGGSTGAKLMEAPDGKLYVVKTGSSPEHLREEFRAEQAYRAAGVPIPNSTVEEVNGRPHKISEFIEGKQLSELDEKAKAAAIKQIQKGFATDALLANWDVAGMSLDNVIVAKDGTAYRIDVGGALRYRAQGSPKGDKFGNHPLELWSLRDSSKNASGAKVFGELTNKDLVESARVTLQNREAVLAAVKDDKALQGQLEKRLDNLTRFVQMSDDFRGDKWKDKHIDRLTYHDQHADAAGVFSKWPAKMAKKEGQKYTAVDENGKDWDHLRGKDSSVSKFAKYCEDQGLNHEVIQAYNSAQGQGSWSIGGKAMKHYVAASRDLPDVTTEYFFQAPLADCKNALATVADRLGTTDAKVREAFTANQAYYYRFCKQVEFTNNDRENGVLYLARTESPGVVQRYGLEEKKFGEAIRGAAESYSLHTSVCVTGNELTLQAVPHTRIFAHYYHERTPGTGDHLLYGDNENEVVADAHGCKVYYAKANAKTGYAIDPEPLKKELAKKKKSALA